MGDADVEVTWEDQKKINRFGTLNARLHDLQDVLNQKEEEIRKLEDAADQVMLTDDDKVLYRIGEVYVAVQKDDVEGRIDNEKDAVYSQIAAKKKEIEETQAILQELKKQLYGKFKENINLDE
mmetsp:Transcript_35710/g.89666  ORF Transcript_35710/g.89666 Transcript_35710/m.89666 type:complete len:123 (-) Transcript_35710:52-420(-)